MRAGDPIHLIKTSTNGIVCAALEGKARTEKMSSK
jgi:hypothetical protein